MQLRKSAHKANRNRVPCVFCGLDHPTWQHGKSDEAIAQERLSRQKNSRDPWFVKPAPKPTKETSVKTLIAAVGLIAAAI